MKTLPDTCTDRPHDGIQPKTSSAIRRVRNFPQSTLHDACDISCGYRTWMKRQLTNIPIQKAVCHGYARSDFGRTAQAAYLVTKPQNVRERPKHNTEAINPHMPIINMGFLPRRSDSLFQ